MSSEQSRPISLHALSLEFTPDSDRMAQDRPAVGKRRSSPLAVLRTGRWVAAVTRRATHSAYGFSDTSAGLSVPTRLKSVDKTVDETDGGGNQDYRPDSPPVALCRWAIK